MNAVSLTLAPNVTPAFAKALRARIATALEWYMGCDLCSETIRNIDRDLASVLKEEVQRFRLAPLGWKLKAWTGTDGIIEVRRVMDRVN